MDRIALMQTYLAVAETGSFKAAAKRLGITPQLASKYIRALEDTLGVQLFLRSTRRVRLTETGAAYFDRCARLLDDFDELLAAVRQDHIEPKGRLRVTAPTTFGIRHLVDVLSDFSDSYPDVTIDLHLTDRFVDLLEEGVDVAIRIGTLSDSALVARRIATTSVPICASPDYLAAHPAPERPEDLAEHRCIIDTNFRDRDQWPFVVDGTETKVRVGGRFFVNSASAARALALKGQGITLCPGYEVGPDLASGALVPLLADFQSHELGIFAIYPENRHLSAKVRVFVDHIVRQIKTRDGLAL